MAMSLAIGDGPPIGGDGVTKQKAVVEKYNEVGFDRHCVEIVTQTSLLTDHLAGADLTVPVPTCPGWNVSQLARHVDGGQRWARDIVTTRAVASTRRCGRPWAPMWGRMRRCGAPSTGGGSASYARRFAYETAMHRADAALALGVEYALDPDIAADAVDEWTGIGLPTSSAAAEIRATSVTDLLSVPILYRAPPPSAIVEIDRRRDARRLLVGASRFRLRLSDRGRRPRAGMRTTPGSARRRGPSASSSCCPMIAASSVRPSRCRHSW